MADEPIIGQQKEPERVSEGQLMEWPCGACNQKAHFEVPTMEVVNVKSYASYHFPLSLQQCENCGHPYIFRLGPLMKGGMTFMFVPVKENIDRNGIITAPADAVPNIRMGVK